MPEKNRFPAVLVPQRHETTAPLTQNPYADNESRESLLVTHSLRADGFDASEDGTGRGTPLVPVGFMPARTLAKDGEVDSRYAPHDVCDAIHTNSGSGNKAPLIVFSCKDSGLDSGELSPTLRGMGHSGSHANAGGQVAIAIQERAICENTNAGPDGAGVRLDDQAYTVEARQVPQAVAFVQNTRDEVRLFAGNGQSVGALAAEPGMKQQKYLAFNLRGREGGSLPESCDQASLRSASGGSSSRSYVTGFQGSQSGIREVDAHATLDSNNGSRRHNGVIQAMQVRRLTPTECERLQDFPDEYTKINDKTADGPRYKALGNSMAVCCMEWIGRRIQMAEDLTD